jgi:hypothetical protein
MAFDGLFRERGHAGGDLSVDRNIGDAHFLHRSDERSRFARMTIQKTFPLEGAEVLHDRGLAGEAKMMLDLARARRDSFFPLLGLDEFQNAPLALGEHVSMISREGWSASSNEHNVDDPGYNCSMKRQLKRYLIELSGPTRQVSEREIEIRQSCDLSGRIRRPA